MPNAPRDYGVADYAHAMRIRNHDGAIEEAGIFKPGGAGHFTIAIEREPGAEDFVGGGFSAWKNGGDAGADRPFADFEFSFARDECSMTHLDSTNVGDGVVGTGIAIKRNAQIAGARLGLAEGNDCREDQRTGAEPNESLHI